ncbi:MAG: class II aldolase/adducin family protein [Myxococcota bacterium]
MSSDIEARELIVQIVQELFAAGHLTSTGGNVSNRSSDGETVWITPRGLHKGALTVDSLVRIRADGSVVEGSNEPSIEYRMHFRAYDARPGSIGAVHTHSPVATAFGICNQKFEPINTDAIGLADTQTVPWFMPGTAELADAVFDAMQKSRGAILQNHGLMAVGEDLRQAATRAAMIEETAKIALYVKQFGGEVSLLSHEAVERLGSIAEFL